MIGDDSARTLKVEASIIVASLIKASVVLTITLADSATPTPTPPAATPKERASIVVPLVELIVSAPPASITAPAEISAVVNPVITFAERDTITPTVLAAATPPEIDIMFKLELAITLRSVPLVTVELSMLDVTVLTTTLAPTKAPTATAPDPATLIAAERIKALSTAVTATAPPLFTTEPALIRDSTLLVITLPYPVAFTATAPEPATPTVKPIIPALE